MAVAEKRDGQFVELDYSQFEDVYFSKQLATLEEVAKGNSPEEVKAHYYSVGGSLSTVVKDLKKVGKVVKDRLVTV